MKMKKRKKVLTGYAEKDWVLKWDPWAVMVSSQISKDKDPKDVKVRITVEEL